MSWTKTAISEFLFERKGKYKPQDEDIQGLQRVEKIDFKGNFYIGDKASKTNMILVKNGDLVISGINIAKGAMCIYTGEKDVVATIHYSSYTFDENKINVNYFKRFLKSPEFIKLISEQVKGGIKTEIKPKHILPLEINLPDIDTQNVIVSNFEKLDDDMTTLDGEVEYQQNMLTKLKQSILQEAIEGKLTSKWREQNQDIEPASVLLEKIKAEKEHLIKENKIKKSKPLAEISEDEIPFEIPSNWKWTHLDKVSINRDGDRIPVSQAERERKDKIYDYYGASGVIDKIDGFTHNGDFLLIGEDGANLVARSTPIAFIASGKFWVNNHAHVLEFNNDTLLNYIKYYINAIDLKPYITGGFQPKLSQTNLNKIKVSLPPIEEQKEVINQIEKLFAICDELEEQINSSKQNTQTLMQAVLKEAFER